MLVPTVIRLVAAAAACAARDPVSSIHRLEFLRRTLHRCHQRVSVSRVHGVEKRPAIGNRVFSGDPIDLLNPGTDERVFDRAIGFQMPLKNESGKVLG